MYKIIKINKMKTYKSDTGRTLYKYLLANFGECRFSADQLENAIDLAIRRGAEGRRIISEAVNFLYS